MGKLNDIINYFEKELESLTNTQKEDLEEQRYQLNDSTNTTSIMVSISAVVLSVAFSIGYFGLPIYIALIIIPLSVLIGKYFYIKKGWKATKYYGKRKDLLYFLLKDLELFQINEVEDKELKILIERLKHDRISLGGYYHINRTEEKREREIERLEDYLQITEQIWKEKCLLKTPANKIKNLNKNNTPKNETQKTENESV